MDTQSTSPNSQRVVQYSLGQQDGGQTPLIGRELRSIPLRFGDVLVAQDQVPERVYFPDRGLIATEYRAHNSDAVTVELIGHQGAVGLECLLDVPAPSIGRACVAVAGSARFIPAQRLHFLSPLLPSLRQAAQFAMQARTLEIAQAALCHARHSLEARCARWLLMLQDRLGAGPIMVTHEFVARSLGVRRAGVTCALGAFQHNGLISQSRAQIRIVDRPGLEAASCTCYGELNARIAALKQNSPIIITEPRFAPDGLRSAIRAAVPAEMAGPAEVPDELRRAAVLEVCRDVIRRCNAALHQ